MRKTKLKSKTGLKSKTSLKARSSLKKSFKKMRSKKVDEWKALRTSIYEELATLGVNSCELRLDGCLGSFALGLAHSKKRMHIKTSEEMREVVLACTACHDHIENLPKQQMEDIVKLTILKRNLC